MIKCNVCVNHKPKGGKHICSKCDIKIIYGVMQEPFIECCPFFTMTETEKHRRAYLNKIKSRPIDDRAIGIRR